MSVRTETVELGAGADAKARADRLLGALKDVMDSVALTGSPARLRVKKTGNTPGLWIRIGEGRVGVGEETRRGEFSVPPFSDVWKNLLWRLGKKNAAWTPAEWRKAPEIRWTWRKTPRVRGIGRVESRIGRSGAVVRVSLNASGNAFLVEIAGGGPFSASRRI